MSVRIYLKAGITKSVGSENCWGGEQGERAYLWPSTIKFQDLRELDLIKVEHFDYFTVDEAFWKEADGFSFTPGYYKGEGFEVTISPGAISNRGSNKNSFHDWRQNVFGRFNSQEIAVTFWDALTSGEILPTRPLCRELSLTEQAYAKQASSSVALSSRFGTQEALIAQLFVHVKSLQQIIQDRVLTPRT